MFERFTDSARHVVVQAVQEAAALGSPEVRATHLLLALSLDTGPAGQVLHRAGLDPEVIRAVLQQTSPPAEPLDREALLSLGIDLDEVRRVVEQNFGPGALDAARRSMPGHRRAGRRGRGAGRVRFDESAKRSLERGLRQAVGLGSGSLGSEHLLLGVLTEPTPEVATVVARGSRDAEGLRHDLLERLRRAA